MYSALYKEKDKDKKYYNNVALLIANFAQFRLSDNFLMSPGFHVMKSDIQKLYIKIKFCMLYDI